MKVGKPLTPFVERMTGGPPLNKPAGRPVALECDYFVLRTASNGLEACLAEGRSLA